MLTQLTIKNFAIIDELNINFKDGLTVITGETGTGKSIIFDALDFLLGKRAGIDIIKTGTNKTFVEGIFSISIQPDWFYENGFDISDELIISRELSSQGSRVRINGSLANVSHLSFLKPYLVTIHEQSEHLELLKIEKQLAILDNLGDLNHKNLLDEYRNVFQEYKDLKLKLNSYLESSKEQIKKIGFLKHELNEIKSANIENTNEENELIEERDILLNKKELIENANLIYEMTDGSSVVGHGPAHEVGEARSFYERRDCSLQGALSQIKKLLIKSSEYDKSFEPYIETIENVICDVKDLSSFVNDYLDGFSEDDSLNEIEERLNLFYKLKKKYGSTLAEVQEHYKKIECELDSLENSSLSEEELQSTFQKKEAKINILSEKLTRARENLARDFVNRLHEELMILGFNRGGGYEHIPLLVIEFIQCELSENGKEQIQFLFSSNPDEPPKPLLKVASGGELSRIMLGIKSISCTEQSGLFRTGQYFPTMLFDEIDMGVSGEIASNVAKKLYKISRSNQAICITHQPIIAAIADNYFMIEKDITQGSTQVSIKEIHESEKANALAILLTPEKNLKDGICEDAKIFAKSLLENARGAQSLCTEQSRLFRTESHINP